MAIEYLIFEYQYNVIRWWEKIKINVDKYIIRKQRVGMIVNWVVIQTKLL